MACKLISDLSDEHRVIERLLASLLRATAKAQLGDYVTKRVLGCHLDLFRELMDDMHHGREEDILFDCMIAAGLPREQGPVGVMLAEHEQGRGHVAALGRIAATGGAMEQLELEALGTHSSAFVQLLSSHIAKEDGILYPMAYRVLGEAGIERIDALDLARQNSNAGARDRLMAQAEQLAEETLGTGAAIDSPKSACAQ